MKEAIEELLLEIDNFKKEYVCEETGDEVVLMKDRQGRVIGFEKLNFSLAREEQLSVAFEAVG
ncbi:MAG: DUF2283 domain-containing protein [candidate division NC10 bacterium]|nr:DUF2283 domain-containing protein [candidate division NC10 bacterium]